MGLLDLLNPIEAIGSVKTIAKDISNYRFYRKKIKLIEESGIFKDRKMRVDYLSRVYYVVNLEPELQLATGDLVDLEKSRVYESVYRLQGVFADHNLVEIVDVSSKRIKDSDHYAYLVTISYKVESETSDLIRSIILGIESYYLMMAASFTFHNWSFLKDSIINLLSNK